MSGGDAGSKAFDMKDAMSPLISHSRDLPSNFFFRVSAVQRLQEETVTRNHETRPSTRDADVRHGSASLLPSPALIFSGKKKRRKMVKKKGNNSELHLRYREHFYYLVVFLLRHTHTHTRLLTHSLSHTFSHTLSVSHTHTLFPSSLTPLYKCFETREVFSFFFLV